MQKGPHHLPVAPYVIYDAILKALPDDYDENEVRPFSLLPGIAANAVIAGAP